METPSWFWNNRPARPAGPPPRTAMFPVMRDSQVEPAIQQMLGPMPQQMTGEEVMRAIMASGGPPSNGNMADARRQEIAYANQPQNPAGSMGAARQQEIAYANAQPNPRAPAGPAKGGQMYGPTMADMPNGGQPAYYTMDPGDGGILRTFMSPNGMAPNIPGMTATNMQPVDPNQGALAKFLRGAF